MPSSRCLYGDSDFSGRWQRIKSRFTRHVVAGGAQIARDRRGEYQLWQRRFWEHTIRDDRDFATHIDYIHYNPVKHGLVCQVSNWPHSSFHRYVRDGVLPRDWAGSTDQPVGGFGERIRLIPDQRIATLGRLGWRDRFFAVP